MTVTTKIVGPATEERVILCSPDGTATGTALKAEVHRGDTPLHLAFSCYVFDRQGRVLVTRRARTKRVFPGVRTNSCCGHPAPGEGMAAAVGRRLREELGVVAPAADLLLPTFRYRATAPDGTVENELCPVYRVVTDDDAVAPAPAEVDDAWWVPWAELSAELPVELPSGLSSGLPSGLSAQLQAAPPDDADPLSPWAVWQVRRLVALGPDPLRWPSGDPAQLPPAALP